MKNFLFILLVFLGNHFMHGAMVHPIKLTSSLIKYDKENKEISIECKVFIDDFSPTISDTLEDNIGKSKIPPGDLKKIEDYFTQNFKITINGKTLLWKIESYDIEMSANVLTLSFSKTSMALREGDAIKIENTLLFDSFGDVQSNWMTLRVPPFIRDDNFETNTFKHIYKNTL